MSLLVLFSCTQTYERQGKFSPLETPSALRRQGTSILSILPIIVIFIFLQKYITGGIATTGVKG